MTHQMARLIASGLFAVATAVCLVAMGLGEFGSGAQFFGFLGGLVFGMISIGLLLSSKPSQNPNPPPPTATPPDHEPDEG